ncbi:Serpin B8 [Nymphon striatum]|nr:Serpin B8 [Nymphon striatum]
MTVMAILNAVYFKGSWEKKFNQNETKNETFLSVKGSSQVQMMYKDDTLVIGDLSELGATYIDIPYFNDRFSILAILPSERNPNIDRVVQELTLKHVQSMFNNEQSSEPVTLGFPRFEVVESCALKEVLSEIGAEEIFESINLTGIIESLLPMCVSNVFHKVFVKVDEEGTEAAGATAVGCSITSIVFRRRILWVGSPDEALHMQYIKLKLMDPNRSKLKDLSRYL